MSPILRLIASCLLLAGCATPPTSADRPAGAAAGGEPAIAVSQPLEGVTDPVPPPPPADPVIGWARVEFDADGITRTEAGGYADLESMRPLTVDDPVRVASISKLVTALGVMRLVEAGTLDLDADVSTYLGWSLRNPAFPDTPITLRMLLGHRAGLRDDAGYALPLDADLEQWLTQDGAWNGEHPPGQWFSYANVNFPVVAAAMEGATGERFDRLMAREVFEPLGIDACFNWTTCSEDAKARAVVLYREDGRPIRDTQDFIAEDCPATEASDGTCDHDTYVLARNGSAFSPQGGLRISARGLARIGAILASPNVEFLDSSALRTLALPPLAEGDHLGFAPHSEDAFDLIGDTEDIYCTYAIGIHVLNHNLAGYCREEVLGDFAFGHSGEAYGLRSGLWVTLTDPDGKGTGVAYFATGLPEFGAMHGRSAFTAIEERLAQGLPVETYVPDSDWHEPEDGE